mgnify:CR=1 FL=1
MQNATLTQNDTRQCFGVWNDTLCARMCHDVHLVPFKAVAAWILVVFGMMLLTITTAICFFSLDNEERSKRYFMNAIPSKTHASLRKLAEARAALADAVEQEDANLVSNKDASVDIETELCNRGPSLEQQRL